MGLILVAIKRVLPLSRIERRRHRTEALSIREGDGLDRGDTGANTSHGVSRRGCATTASVQVVLLLLLALLSLVSQLILWILNRDGLLMQGQEVRVLCFVFATRSCRSDLTGITSHLIRGCLRLN